MITAKYIQHLYVVDPINGDHVELQLFQESSGKIIGLETRRNYTPGPDYPDRVWSPFSGEEIDSNMFNS